MSVQNNLATIQENIQKACEKSNRNPEDVQIIAVTKYVTVDRAQEAIEAGVSHLGENRAEGFQDKYTAIGDQVHWHFIGTLQSRKVKEIVHQVDFIHSLDRKSLAKEINKRAEKPISCFVQVNVSGESSKHGLEPDEVSDFIQSLKDYPKINIVGLMTMAPHTDEEEVIRNCFRSLRQLQLEIQQLSLDFAPCQYLSMGMSNDYQIAIEEGATHIRIGSSLVGEE
ncbi:YggS family pyridoxal phosphate-dependent enzyme [Allobacillus halotolerans]|uniref:Pyridoxal phosphate homeostasis protein n=1 Tax=Allobacillus halotolerans TaxID=570278 RepID=A0ABS6GRT0_9BACI|nr:YggS family pyridoxal phosphate-dependent enzyme [Allobacillus halotolerans]MBU6081369.1 YggS family pyridoxal phosphate-dependent enzyme [Allobacillus halotolerans]